MTTLTMSPKISTFAAFLAESPRLADRASAVRPATILTSGGAVRCPNQRAARLQSAGLQRNRTRMVAGLGLFVAMSALALVFFFAQPSAASAPKLSSINTSNGAPVTWVVQPGDTLWQIARAVQPEGDVRPLVDQLQAARQGKALQAGEHLVVG